MSDTYKQCTVAPSFPPSVCTPISLQVLSDVGFDWDIDPETNYHTFYSDGLKGDTISDFWPPGERPTKHFQGQGESVLEQSILANFLKQDMYLTMGYADIFQDMAIRAGINEVAIEGAITCDEHIPGGFGGWVYLITPKFIRYVDTQDILEQFRDDDHLCNNKQQTSENNEMTGKNIGFDTLEELKARLLDPACPFEQTPSVGQELCNRLINNKLIDKGFDRKIDNQLKAANLKELQELGISGEYTDQDLAIAWELFDRLCMGGLSETKPLTGLIHCYSIQQWDGGENQNHAFYLLSETEANRYLAYPKHKNDLAIPCVVRIFETVEQSIQYSSKAVRERALAKLTEEEKYIINLK